MSAKRWGEFRWGEARFGGIQIGISPYSPTAGDTRGYKCVFYSAAGTKVGEVGSDLGNVIISSLTFELQDFGCGAFSIEMSELPTFTIGYRTRVVIYPYFDSTPWFSGYVKTVPQPGQSIRPYVFEGFGFFEQLDWVLVTGSYAGIDVAAAVADIVQNTVAANTQILYNAAKIESTGYTISATGLDFDHVTAKEALQSLADIAQEFEFGVDNSMEFFFRARETAETHQRWAGLHFADVEISEDPSEIVNRIHVKGGTIQSGGSNIIGTVSDAASIAANGLHEAVETAPEILDYDDAMRWAAQILAEKKDPIQSAQLTGIILDDTKAMIEARGLMRVTGHDGTSYSLDIARVEYTISPAGIRADVELGKLEEPMEKTILDIMRRVEEESRLADKRTSQLA